MAVVGARVTDTKSSDMASGDDRERARKWMAAIEKAEGDLEDYWNRCDKIRKIYTEQRKEGSSTAKKFSILWANVTTLQPATYARTPQPVVKRRFNDRDPLAREVSTVTERALEFMYDLGAFDETMRAVRDDFLLYGRSTAWVRYEPKFQQDDPEEDLDQTSLAKEDAPALAGKPDPAPDEKKPDLDEPANDDVPPPPVERIVDERIRLDFLPPRDFIHPQARSWNELPWVCRKIYLDRKKLKARFGDEVGGKVALDHKPEGEKKEDESRDKATVYELWDKEAERVYWLAKGYQDGFLDEDDPPLTFASFFPCPKPAFGTLATDTLIPTPDYVYYEDQASEIDNVTNRIDKITSQLKLVGFYPSGGSEEGAAAIEQAFGGTENKLIPIPSMAAWAERGGANAIQWVPIDQAVAVLRELFDVRARLIQDVYQITGISDIVRGASDPRETMGAQRIKAQWGSVRIRDRQLELVRFAADLTKLMAEVISDKFQASTLLDMTGVKLRYRQQVLDEFTAAMAQYNLAAQQAQGQFQQAQMAFQQAQAGYQQQAQVAQQQYQQAMIGHQAAQQAQGTQLPPPPQPQLPPPPQPPQPPNIPPPPQPSQELTIDDVVELMRDDRMRTFRIDIETDSTIEADENENKQRLTELTQTISGFLQQALPAGAANPELVPFLGQLMTTVIRSHRAGRQLEGAIEDLMAQAEEKADQAKAQAAQKASQPPQPPPEIQKLQMELEAEKAKFAAEIDLKRQELALKGREMSLKEAEFQRENQVQQAQLANQVANQVGVGIVEHVAQIVQAVEGLRQDMQAPRQIIRDERGEATAVAINGQVKPIIRDADGVAVGLQ